jgi:uncharacterized membrane-anchored protein
MNHLSNKILILLCAVALQMPTAFAAAAPTRPASTNQPAADEKEDSILNKVTWVTGPASVSLGAYSSVKVPEGFRFTAAQGAQDLLEAMGNPTSGSELGFLSPTNLEWFVIFRFSDVGYVKDDDKDKLNADKLLKSIRQGTEESNKLREKMGAAPMKIIGWEYPPKYNEVTHNLEWAVRGESEGEPVINYNTRILGRKGVMEAKLVIDPEKLQATLPVFQNILKDHTYKTGESYAEYKSGDKIAKYGLAALVTGGAAAVAIKTGLLSTIILFFKKGAKLIVVACVAVGAFFKKLIFGRGRNETSNQ